MSQFLNLKNELSTVGVARLALAELGHEIRRIDGLLEKAEAELRQARMQANLNRPAPARTGAPFESDGFRSPFELFPEKRAGEPEHDQGPEPVPQAEGGLLSDLLAKFGKRR